MEQKIRNCDVHVLTEVTCLRHNIPNLAFGLDEWSHVLSQQIAGSGLCVYILGRWWSNTV